MNTIRNFSRIMCFCTVILSALISGEVRSQSDTSFWNPSLAEIADTSSQEGWIVFKSDISIPPLGLFQDYKDAFGLGIDDEMAMQDMKTDSFDFTHYRYQQKYKGIYVMGGEYSIHANNNVSRIANGRIIKDLSMDITPLVDSATAILHAIQEVQNKEAEKYGVQPSTITLVFDSLHAYKVALVVSKLPSQIWELQNFKLVYNVEVRIQEPSDYVYYVFIDANSGAALETIPGVFYAEGKVTTLYNGDRKVTTKWTGSITQYKLIDESRGDGITTRRVRSGLNQYINDEDNSWNDDYKRRIHASTQWAAGEIWDIFNNTFQRNGPDGGGMGLDIVTDMVASGSCPSNTSAPSSDPLEISLVGPASGICDPRISLNAIGHEFTHGIGYHEAGWHPTTISPTDEAFALMEGYCDIFGEVMEYYSQGWVDWKFDDQSLINKSCVRVFSPPILDGESALEYGDANWNNYPDGHRRCGVLNHWFYLLAEGGYGTNHLGNFFCLSGIGIPKASQILYETLIEHYFNSSSTFIAARNATNQVASLMFGGKSPEARQVVQAWYAVCLGQGISPNPNPDPWFMDNLSDVGTEPNPNPNNDPLWASEDMWINESAKPSDLGHQNAEFGQPNYIHVRIRNKGCAPASGVVKVYWSKAATAAEWPKYWGGLNLGPYMPSVVPAGCNPAIWGDEVSPSKAFGPLEPNEEAFVAFFWSPPDPADFACFDEPWHFCLLARIETTYGPPPYGMTFPEVNSFVTNVVNNNNIIWKNISVEDLKKKKSSSSSFIVRNSHDSIANINLQFEAEQFLNHGQVTIGITPEMYQDWQDGSGTSSGLIIQSNTSLRMTAPLARFDGIRMDPEEIHLIKIGLQLYEDQSFRNDTTFNFIVTQFTESTAVPDGGITMAINVGPVNPRIIIEKTENSLQGHYEFVSIMLEDNPLEMGGFDFLIAYDASALAAISAIPGALLDSCRWEYFTYRFGADGNCGSACPSGLLRIVALAETNDGGNHPSCFGPPDTDPHELAKMEFFISNDRTFECQYVPIRFFWGDCGDNTVSSPNGDTLYIDRSIYDFEGNIIWNEEDDVQFPEDSRISFVGASDSCLNPDPQKPSALRFIDFVSGGIDIVCAKDIDWRGDVNLNGQANEIGDAVVFTNYFIYGSAAFIVNIEGQIAATDINADGIALSVADLVYLINIIVNGWPPIPPMDKPRDLQPAAAIFNKAPDGTLSVSGTDSIGAAYLVVEGEVSPVLKAAGMKMVSRFDGTNTRILIFPPFENNEKNIRGFIGDFLEVKGNLISAELSTIGGFPVRFSNIPTQYALAQNFPNPFNLATQIKFSLPKLVQVKLEIFNVMGQTVRTFIDQQMPAGYHKVTWDCRNNSGATVASGVYFCRFRAGDYVETKRMLLIK